LERLSARVGRDLGDRLVAELLDAEELEPRLTPVRLGAYAIAATVHVLTLGLLLGGAALIALTFFNVLALGAGALAIGVAVIMRPRFGKPREDGMLARREAPALHELADEVAEALDVRPPDIIVVDRRFNASWQIVGLRRRRVLTLGLPLVAILDRQERVALAAHELAHARNGDSTRGLFVGSAINGLAECY
jgi:Zn-dependent protease with chaperone function